MPLWLPPALLAISTLFTLGAVLRLLAMIGRMVGRMPTRVADPNETHPSQLLPVRPRPMAIPRPLRHAAHTVAAAIAANTALALLLATGASAA